MEKQKGDWRDSKCEEDSFEVGGNDLPAQEVRWPLQRQ